MSETTTSPQTGTPGKIVSAGAPMPATIALPGETENKNAPAANEAGAELTDEQKLAAAQAAEAEKNKPLELSDDQLREILKGKGIELDDKGIDGLKEKLKPAAAAPTAEEKSAAEAAQEKRLLDRYIAGGGTAEDYVALKQIANADLTKLSEAELVREMKKDGFDEADIAEMIKERFYQIKLDELEQGEDETPEDFEKRKAKIEKKIAFGSKEFGAKGSFIQEQAKSALSQLREAVQTEDLLVATEAKILSTVDEIVSKMPRKLTLSLGKVNDQEIAPIEFEVPKGVFDEVVETLKDKGKRNQILFNQDSSLNLDSIAQLLMRNKMLEAAVKTTYLEGGNRQVAEFEKRFPGRTAQSIGVGGPNGGQTTGRKGVVVSAGKPQPAGR